jgi:predicted peptidase
MTSTPDWTITGSQSANVDAGIPRAAGVYDIQTRLANQAAGRFTLSLPEAMASAPLVVVLHYAGQPTRFYGRPLLTGLIEPALRSLDAVFVAPESLGGQWHEEANEVFVIGLIKQLTALYPIAADRIVVTGYSMGAIGTWHFITHYPELFSAAIPIAGFPNRELRSAVPVHAFHSAQDELFPLDHLREAASEAQAAGTRLELTETTVNGHFDVNGYAPALARVPEWLEGVWSE